MSDTTMSRVRLPIDDVVDRVYGRLMHRAAIHSRAEFMDILADQTEYVVRGVLAKHRAARKAEA